LLGTLLGIITHRLRVALLTTLRSVFPKIGTKEYVALIIRHSE